MTNTPDTLTASSDGEVRGQSTRTVAAILTTPVKSMALDQPEEIELTTEGILENRRFFLIDQRDKLFVGRRFGPLVRVRPQFDGEVLTLTLPSGEVVSDKIELADEPIETNFYGLRTVKGRVVRGPWAEALAGFIGTSVRLVYADNSDADDLTPVTLLSRASLERLGRELQTELDYRRFRMLFTLDGCGEHEEDTWSRVQIGEAIIRVGSSIGHQVPRCGVITQDPDTGVRSLDALRAIRRYRGRNSWGVPFGVYASIERGGRVRVGDSVEPL